MSLNVQVYPPSLCLKVWEESSQRPAWGATRLAVAQEPLMSPTDDTLWPLWVRTWPFMWTENTSGSELIPTRWRLTEAWAHRLISWKEKKKKVVLFVLTSIKPMSYYFHSLSNKLRLLQRLMTSWSSVITIRFAATEINLKHASWVPWRPGLTIW